MKYLAIICSLLFIGIVTSESTDSDDKVTIIRHSSKTNEPNENVETVQTTELFESTVSSINLERSSNALRSYLSLGYFNANSTLLWGARIYRNAISNVVQIDDLSYIGSSSRILTSIEAVEVGPTNFAYPYLLSGGINQNNATVRIQSARGYGYDYMVYFYGY